MRVFLFLILCLSLNAAYASVEFRQFEKAELEERYNVLVDELRCLVCQNQNLKASNSDLAKDMRDKVYNMIDAGKTNKEIVDYMVERYGDFVLYKPPFKASTLFLWLGPLVFLVIAIITIIKLVGKRNHSGSVELSDEEHKRAQALLNNMSDKKDKES